MTQRITISLIVLTLFSVSIYSAKSQSIVPDAKLRTGKLSNGLTYYIRHNDKPTGRADFYLAQKVGSVLEEENQRGLAHFLEHMAFNGTKNFPGRSLIGVLERHGVRFGANINASTSYDETIYKLMDIPVSDNGIIDTALLILHDWSGFISNNDQDIEEERGVIREEWRTRSIAMQRILENGVFPVIFAGSAYANRIPIGSMDVVNNFKPQQLKDYYHKWYRPDLQAIIVVGDIDVDKMEARIKSLFAAIPTPVNPAKRGDFQIPDNKEAIVAVATDPELSDIKMEVYWKRNNYPKEQKSSLDYYKTVMIEKLIGSVITNRFYKIREKNKHTSSISAVMGPFLIVASKSALALNIFPADKDSIAVTLRMALTEMERIKRFGFTAIDLENYKKDALRLLEMGYPNRNKKDNYAYVLKCIANFTTNEPFVDVEWDYQTEKQMISELSLDTVNQVLRSAITDTNMVFVLMGPEKEKAKLPGKEEILEIWKNVKIAKLSPYASMHVEKKVLPKVNPRAGKVLKTEQKPFGFTQWTLSNGARVQFKQTDEKDNDLYIWGYSPGGLSILNEEDLPSSMAMNRIINQGGIVDPDGKGVLTFRVGDYEETLGGRTSNLEDMETFFRLLYLRMSRLEKEPGVFEKYMEGQKKELRGFSLNPKDIFGDTLNSIMGNHHPRALISLKDPETLAKVDYDRIIRIYKERFGNAADFTFFIAGNVKSQSIRPLIEKYIGGLPSSKSREKITDHDILPPSGVVRSHIKTAMKTPQSTVSISYTGKIPMNMENQIMIECLSGVLRMIYIDKMREQEGGTYGVRVNGEMYKLPAERFVFQLMFDTDPQKKTKLMEIAYQEINGISKEEPDGEKLKKVKENLLANYRQQYGQKNTYYWVDRAWWFHINGVDGGSNYEKLLSALTPQKLQAFAKDIFGQGNIIEVTMDPLNKQKGATTTNKNAPKKLDEYSKLEFKLHFENKHRELRDSGFKAWFQHPHDLKRYEWLILTVHNPPSYWKNIQEGALASTTGTIYSAPVDWNAIDEWETKYGLMRKEFMTDRRVTQEQRDKFRIHELYGMFFTALNMERNRNGKLEVKKIGELCLSAANILLKNADNFNSSQLLHNMEMPFFYNTAYGWGMDELQELVRILSVSKVPLMRQWVAKRSALLALRKTPLQMRFIGTNGQIVDLEKLRGKVVLVDYWATSCSVCIKRMHEIKPVYDKYKQKGFEIVSVALNRTADLAQVKKIKEKVGADWLTGLIGSKEGDKVRLDQQVFYKYGFESVPQLLLLDQAGKLVAINGTLQSGDLEPIIKKYLAF